MVRHVRHPLYTVIASPVTESQSQLDSHSDSRLRFSRKLRQLSHRWSCFVPTFSWNPQWLQWLTCCKCKEFALSWNDWSDPPRQRQRHLRAVNVKSLLGLEMLDPALSSKARRRTIVVGTAELLKDNLQKF